MVAEHAASRPTDRGRIRGGGDEHIADLSRHLKPGSKSRLVIIDLNGLPSPQRVLNDLHVLMKPDRVLVLTAIGTVLPHDIEHLRLHVLRRPIVMKENGLRRLRARVIQSAGKDRLPARGRH